MTSAFVWRPPAAWNSRAGFATTSLPYKCSTAIMSISRTSKPANYRHVPYVEIAWPYQRDRNLQGEPLRAGGKIYLKGIAMHSAARLTYRLDGTYRRFDADVALDDSTGNRGSVTFAVYLLRDGKWQEAFKSGIVCGGQKPDRVSVDLTGAAAITLTVDYADRGDELDHADWLDARLVK